MPAMASILVVDHNAATRQTLRYALATAGYDVLEATCGRAALAVAAQALPDMIVQDLLLPDLDGFELLRRFRHLHGGNEVPILALAGFLGPIEDVESGASHFTACFLKPIELVRFLAAVRAYLPPRRTGDTSLGRGRHLLVVDDDPVQLKLTRLHFSHAGFDVSEASDGEHAFAAARARPPDVILCDVFMPHIDGFQLCLDCRHDPRLATVPIVLLSGRYGSVADQALARRVGANALVLRTPNFEQAEAAMVEGLSGPAARPAESPTDHLALTHARLVIHQLEQQLARLTGVAERCGVQATQLSMLEGIVDGVIDWANLERAFQDRFSEALHAAGIAKGALLLRDTAGAFTLRHPAGFSPAERVTVGELFDHHHPLIEDVVAGAVTVTVPSASGPNCLAAGDILLGAQVATAQLVPLASGGEGIGVLLLGGTLTDITSDEAIAFGQVLATQVVRLLQLIRAAVTMREPSQEQAG